MARILDIISFGTVGEFAWRAAPVALSNSPHFAKPASKHRRQVSFAQPYFFALALFVVVLLPLFWWANWNAAAPNN